MLYVLLRSRLLCIFNKQIPILFFFSLIGGLLLWRLSLDSVRSFDKFSRFQPISPQVVQIEKDAPHCLNFEYVLVLFCRYFYTQLVEDSDVLTGQEFRCEQLDWLKQAETDINFKELAFVNRSFCFDFEFA